LNYRHFLNNQNEFGKFETQYRDAIDETLNQLKQLFYYWYNYKLGLQMSVRICKILAKQWKNLLLNKHSTPMLN